MSSRLPCLFCEYTTLHTQTLVAHAARVHHRSLNTMEAIYGLDCPACGQRTQALGRHTQHAHELQVPLLFAKVRHTDPTGVIGQRLAHLSQLLLTDAEASVLHLLGP